MKKKSASICENCVEQSYCTQKPLKYYKFNDGSEYEACTSHHKSVKRMEAKK